MTTPETDNLDIIITDTKCFRSCPNKATKRLWIHGQDFHFCERCHDIVETQVAGLDRTPPEINSQN